MDLDLYLYVLYASVGRSIAFQDEKRADPENKAGLCERCQIFWKKLFCSGGKSSSGNEDGTIMLSRPEKVLEADGNQEFAQPDIEDLVIARNTVFCPQRSDLHFQKEIYSEKDALFVKENIRIRAVYSKKDCFSEIRSGFSDGRTQNMRLQFMMNVIWVKGYQVENSL